MRITWVDNLRGLGIILIVAGHSFFPENSIFIQYIFSFHVVLFFFLSGLLFHDIKYPHFIPYISNKFKRLIIPFIVFNAIMFFFLKVTDKGYDVTTLAFIKGILYGSYLPGNEDIRLVNIPTWFLISLFIVNIYYFYVNKFISSRMYRLGFLTLISYVIYLTSTHIQVRLPLSLEISLFSGLFYGIGHIFQKSIFEFVEKIKVYYIIFIPLLISINLFLGNTANLSTNHYGKSFLFLLINGFAGIAVFIIFSKLIPKNIILDVLGKNSIIILGMEWIKFIVLSLVIRLSFGLLVFEASYVNAVIQIISTLLALIPIIYITNKYFPFILGGYFKKP